MGSRWRQENHYRYARMHFDLDSHDTYRAGQDDPTRMVPNPAKKLAYQQVEKARRALHSAETTRDRELLAASTPPPGTTTVLTNTMINTINTDVHTAQATLEAALTAHQALPARLPLAQVHPGQQVLDTETKLIHHAIRIAAFNTAQSLARAILTDTGYTRGDDEAHTPDPHRPGRIRRHHPRRRHPAHPPRPAPRTTAHRRHRRTLPTAQRHPHRLPRHRPDPALQHQIPPVTLQSFRRYVGRPGPSGPEEVLEYRPRRHWLLCRALRERLRPCGASNKP